MTEQSTAESPAGSGIFIPALTTTDWGAEWKALQKARGAEDVAERWDKRSSTYPSAEKPSPYVESFLELARILPGERVLDMGCGAGALAVPLALMSHDVVAADFSTGMLGALERAAITKDITSIDMKIMSWEDDWAAHQLGPDSVDVAISSRSIATADMAQSLAKLTAVARRRCCVTLPVGSSPKTDTRVMTAIGLQGYLGRDYLYAVMILSARGLLPQVSFITRRSATFDSLEEAVDYYSAMAREAAGSMVPAKVVEDSVAKLPSWLQAQLAPNPEQGRPDEHGNPEKALHFTEPDTPSWAFVAWDKRL